jgi:hypothetical protein
MLEPEEESTYLADPFDHFIGANFHRFVCHIYDKESSLLEGTLG